MLTLKVNANVFFAFLIINIIFANLMFVAVVYSACDDIYSQ